MNLAIAQIRRATEQNGVTQTWASQPGMIRVYGTEKDATTSNARSKMVAMYKLYSDDRMVVMKDGVTSTSGGLTTTEVATALNADEADLANWQKVPGMYVDLNEPAPVVLADSQKVGIQFPIADPRAIFPRAGGVAVEGFNFRGNTKAAVPLAGAVVPGTLMPADENNLEARLPMPVRWLYQLADGRLLAPTGGTAEAGLEFPETDRPTEANPIVGRLAFWTDDDSTKININTATEGTAWDMPRAYTDSDAKYARKQPAQNEFSRYPGHPAQTSLSPVFQAFGEPWRMDLGMADAEVSARVQRYHAISPASLGVEAWAGRWLPRWPSRWWTTPGHPSRTTGSMPRWMSWCTIGTGPRRILLSPGGTLRLAVSSSRRTAGTRAESLQQAADSTLAHFGKCLAT